MINDRNASAQPSGAPAETTTLESRKGDLRARDLTIQRVRVLPGDPVHVLRLRTGEFVDPAQVRPTVDEDSVTSTVATGEVLPRPNGSSIRRRLRTLGPVGEGRSLPERPSAEWRRHAEMVAEQLIDTIDQVDLHLRFLRKCRISLEGTHW